MKTPLLATISSSSSLPPSYSRTFTLFVHAVLTVAMLLLLLLFVITFVPSSHSSSSSSSFSSYPPLQTHTLPDATHTSPSPSPSSSSSASSSSSSSSESESESSPPSWSSSFSVPWQWCYNCSDRCSNVVESIQFFAQHISNYDRAYKFREMAASLPRFFRGVDHLYLEDVFNLPRDSKFLKFTSHRTRTFVDGDMHLYNYGTFDNSYHQVIYDMNDFDELLIDNYQVDLYRTATSLVVHMRINGISHSDQDKILLDFGHAYYETVSSFVGNDDEVTAYLTVNNTDGPIFDMLDEVSTGLSRRQMLDKWTYHDHTGQRRFNTDKPKLQTVDQAMKNKFIAAWPQYLNSLGETHRYGKNPSTRPLWLGDWTKANTSQLAYFRIKDVARRLNAGLGSVGTPRFYILCEGPSLDPDDDILLDVKCERTPSWLHFVHDDVKWINTFFKSEGHRISVGMHALLSHVDTSVGYMELDGDSYLIRPRSPFKESVNVDRIRTPLRFRSYAVTLAAINAVNHARADNDYNQLYVPTSFEDELTAVVGSNVSEFAEILKEYAYMNANRISEDYECFLKSGIAEKAGEAVPGGLNIPLDDD